MDDDAIIAKFHIKPVTAKESQYSDFIDYLCNKFSEEEVNDMFIEFYERYNYVETRKVSPCPQVVRNNTMGSQGDLLHAGAEKLLIMNENEIAGFWA